MELRCRCVSDPRVCAQGESPLCTQRQASCLQRVHARRVMRKDRPEPSGKLCLGWKRSDVFAKGWDVSEEDSRSPERRSLFPHRYREHARKTDDGRKRFRRNANEDVADGWTRPPGPRARVSRRQRCRHVHADSALGGGGKDVCGCSHVGSLTRVVAALVQHTKTSPGSVAYRPLFMTVLARRARAHTRRASAARFSARRSQTRAPGPDGPTARGRRRR